MRIAVIGAVVISGLVGVSLLAAPGPSVGSAARQVMSSAGASHGLVTYSVPLGESRQQLTVVDPDLRTICVYHVDSATGEIALKSARNIHWDLQMVEFNSLSPTPREIRELLEPK